MRRSIDCASCLCRSAVEDISKQTQVDATIMSTNKKADTAASAPTSVSKGSAPTNNSAGPTTKANVTKDPTTGSAIKKANVQKFVAAPSAFKYIFEDEMLQHLMLLNA